MQLIRNDSLKQLLSHWKSDFNAYRESEQIQHDHYISDIIPFMKEVGIMRNVNHVFWKAQSLRMGFLDKGKNNKIKNIAKSPKEIEVSTVLNHPNLEGMLTFIFTFSQVCNLEGQTLKQKMEKIIEIIDKEIE
jgi:translation elongation factor EF-Tu-like GTPase